MRLKGCRRFQTCSALSLPLPACGERVGVRGYRTIESCPPSPAALRASTSPRKRGEVTALAADQRAAAILERTEGFRRRDGRLQGVEVARIFGLRRLLHFEQI